jgi:hypothetical protein
MNRGWITVVRTGPGGGEYDGCVELVVGWWDMLGYVYDWKLMLELLGMERGFVNIRALRLYF